ncbi:hypothetical protein E4T42_07563 [Aureobasidium subglaciale]|nr:hypothetical protein E4T38_06864 [Aureobasidium subglaciale]KAI5218751.1 hypothetical protein E4T40_06726 [Aureobasidium subglaciale]KAI5222334.1 hypothetical protein E4T41_06715 [Aureobasidium subglaciale]KAI5242904.1 hypothetical protein E4T42_07563 [Aureobasidium subglaciale]KAI5259807.1 hypothetical protein E4T46_06532 [Aureobasidium subglaciale]
MPLLGLTSRSPLLRNIGAGFGIFQLTLGLGGIFLPEAMIQQVWGFQLSAVPKQTQILIEAIMQLYGTRNVALGLMILAVRKFSDSRTLGWVLMAEILVATSDGFVQERVTGGGGWQHWMFVPMAVGICMPLLGSTLTV